MLNTGIYKITNIKNNKCYIGSAVNIKVRFYDHRLSLNDKRGQRYFQNAWNKYGEKSFKFETLLYCDKGDLLFYEQRTIDTYQAANGKGYNLSPTAGSNLGVKYSEEAKRKIAKANTGKIRSEETRKKLSKAKKGHPSCMLGKFHSEESKRKMSKAKKGKPSPHRGYKHSEETCRKFSERQKSLIAKGLILGMTGKRHSEETKCKISDAKKGSKHTEETKAKMRGRIPWNKGKTVVHSEEMKAKISRTLKGRKKSKETRKKLSEAAKQQWERYREEAIGQ